jgi:hypothetical protein
MIFSKPNTSHHHQVQWILTALLWKVSLFHQRQTMLNRLGVPSDNPIKRSRKLTMLTLSAMVSLSPSNAAQLIQPLDILQNDGPISTIQGQNMGLARLRYAFSSTQLGLKTLRVSSGVVNVSSTCPLRFNSRV